PGGLGKDSTVEKTLWQDIKKYYSRYAGGRLYRYDPKKSNDKVKLSEAACELEDLGMPAAQNAIYALTISPGGNEIYGLTYPDGHFFSYAVKEKKFSRIGPVDEKIVFHGPERYWRSLSRALV